MKQTNNIEQIKVLAIAPYQGLILLLEKEVKKYPQISLDTTLGNLEEGVQKALTSSKNSYDVIISRGGTAELLKNTIDIPIIEVPLSFYDIFRAIQMSSNLGDKRAVVGFESITHNVKIINDLLDLNLDIYTLVDANDTEKIMRSLVSKNYDAVLCDVVSSKIALEYGLNPILFASGEESVNNAFKEVFKITSFLKKSKEKTTFFKELIKNPFSNTVVFSEDGEIFYSTISETEYCKLFDFLRDIFHNSKKDFAEKTIKTIDNKTYHIFSSQKALSGKTYFIYNIYIAKLNELNKHAGIRSYSSIEAKNYYLEYSLYGLWISMQKSQIDKLSSISNPILITGMYGTGKTLAGISIYLNSQKKNHPLFLIDCSLLSDKTKDFLLSNHHSPLFYTNNTILIVNVHHCDNSFFEKLIKEMKYMNVCVSNKVIFTFNQSINNNYAEYINRELFAFQLNMPSLKDYPDKIPSIINTYLSQINAKHAIEILRLSKNAMDLAINYSWNGNFIQLQQVISQAAINSTDHIIHSFNLQSLLSQEDYTQNYTNQNITSINMHKTLYEIEKDIIAQVLKENNGNQTAAAKQLGIGRTTLWRLYNSNKN